MRRFFFRLWIGACVFFVITEVLSWAYYSLTPRASGKEYLDRLLAPGYRTAALDLSAGRVTMAGLRERYGYPVELIPDSAVSEATRSAVDDGGGYASDWQFGWQRLEGRQELLRFGPLPTYDYSWDLLVSLGVTFLFALAAAGTLHLLMRQTRSDLESLEDAAVQMASGRWEARAPEAKGHATQALSAAFNRMAEKTSALIEAQRYLLRAASHELRTPIARLQTGMHILGLTEDRDGRARRVEELDRDFEELSDLVDELLTYSRFEGALDDERTAGTFYPGPELDRLERQFAGEASPRGVGTIIRHRLPSSPVAGDGRLFRRVVGNLLANATRHAIERVHVEAELAAGALRVTVDDDGPGIPPGERERVFEPFVRVDRQDAPAGHGMGLAIVRRIVLRQGGRVAIESSPLGGCRVIVNWPAAADEDPD